MSAQAIATVKASVVTTLSNFKQWLKALAQFIKFNLRIFERWTVAKFGYRFAVGVRCGFSVATGKVRLTYQLRDGSEYTSDMSVAMAEALVAELNRCIDGASGNGLA